MADVPLNIVSENAASERRITPSWSISQLRTKLEPITGIPPSSQRLSLRVPGSGDIAIEAADEDNTQLSNFPLTPYAELHVSPLFPQFDITKYTVYVVKAWTTSLKILGTFRLFNSLEIETG